MKFLIIALFMSLSVQAEQEPQYSVTINSNDLPNFLSLIEKRATVACLDGVLKVKKLKGINFSKEQAELLQLYCQGVGSNARKAIKAVE